MVLVSKYSLFVALLVTLAAGLPSPVEENEDKHSYVIQNMNVYINCIFNGDSAECKDNTGKPAANEQTDPHAEDVHEDVDAIKTGDETNGNDSAPVSDNSPTDSVQVDDTGVVLESEGEPMYDDDRYENMEKYGDLWQYSVTARNEFCLVCLAIMLEQEAALYYRDQLAQSLNKPNNSFSSSLVDTFSDVNTDIAIKKQMLGIADDKPIPTTDEQELCSSLARQRLLKRAEWAINPARRRAKNSEHYRRIVEYFVDFIYNLRDDPQFMQCGAPDPKEYKKLTAIFRSAVDDKS